nr:MAG TPA: hypothetical protein [Caudoviricetes sp.]
MLYSFLQRNTKDKNKKRCKNNVLERFTKQCKLSMEPVGVLEILL